MRWPFQLLFFDATNSEFICVSLDVVRNAFHAKYASKSNVLDTKKNRKWKYIKWDATICWLAAKIGCGLPPSRAIVGRKSKLKKFLSLVSTQPVCAPSSAAVRKVEARDERHKIAYSSHFLPPIGIQELFEYLLCLMPNGLYCQEKMRPT